MGIQGLLPFLKKIHQPVDIADFSGCTVAIDAYCWLHKGAFSCAEKLAMGEKTDQYVYYCMKYVDYLLRKGLKPIMVFDGCHLKSKENVEKSRRGKRELNRKKAAQFLREGKRNEAKECLQRCVDITPQMALNLMNVCRDRGVDCIVAPYEADAQLAYLNLSGIAQLIVTEDSDLLLFGCEKVIFKMDFFGRGILIEKSRLNEVLSIQDSSYNFEKFRHMCILSGCDYLASLHGVGLVKACKVFKVARQQELRLLLKKLPIYMKMNLNVTEEYITGFERAENTFLYQLVYCPLQRRLVPLNPYPPDVNKEELDYAGQYLPEEKAYQIALGNVDIHTHKHIAFFDPLTFQPKSQVKPQYRHQLSIWDKEYRVKPVGSPCKTIQPSSRPPGGDTWQTSRGKSRTVHLQLPTRAAPKVEEVKEPGVIDKEAEQLLMSQYETTPAPDIAENGDIDDEVNVSSQKENLKEEDLEVPRSCSPVDAEEDKSAKMPDSLPHSPKKSKKRKVPSWLEETKIETAEEIRVKESESDTFNDQVVSPRKAINIFAKSPSKKAGRFNLDVHALRVKSRYFGATSPPFPIKTVTSPPQPLPKVSPTPALKKENPTPSPKTRLLSMFENAPLKVKKEASSTPVEEQRSKPKSGLHMFFHTVNKQPSDQHEGVSLSNVQNLKSSKGSTKNNLTSQKVTNISSTSPSQPLPNSNRTVQNSQQPANSCKAVKSRLSAFCWSKSDTMTRPAVPREAPFVRHSSCTPVSSSTASDLKRRKVDEKGHKEEKKCEVVVMESVGYSEFVSSLEGNDSHTSTQVMEDTGEGSEDVDLQTQDSQENTQPLTSEASDSLVSQNSVQSLSQRESLSSIDSYCLDVVDLTDTDQDSQTLAFSRSSQGSSTSSRLSQSSTPSTPSGGCRVSGLSRLRGSKTNSLSKFKAKAKSGGKKSQDERSPGQMSITDMISKYW